jgi:ubiquinone/menaquinone biosynthesis C-methylase UbiE
MPKPGSSPGVASLRYACPKCRRGISAGESLDGWQCPSCGFRVARIDRIFSFTGAVVSEWQRLFEEKAIGPHGDTSSAVEYRSSLQHRYIMDAFRRICGELPPSALILDAGCGNGLFWQGFLAPRPVVGVDYSVHMCALAEAKGVTALHANIIELPFADEQFDLVYCAEILQYIEDLPALIAEFTRLCRDGGRIIVSTVNRTSLVIRGMRAVRALLPRADMPSTFRYFRRRADEIVAAADALPLAVATIGWTHFPIPWLHRSGSQHRAMDWLASNVIVEFLKLPGSA